MKKIAGIILIVTGVAAVVSGLSFVQRLRESSWHCSYDSALRTLLFDTGQALDTCFKRDGQYPQDLRSLKYSSHGDEFCESMFKDLEYAAHGTNCDLSMGTNRLGYAEYLIWRKHKYR